MPVLSDIRQGQVRDAAIDRHELINLSRDAIVGHWGFRTSVENSIIPHGEPAEKIGIQYKQGGGLLFNNTTCGSIVEIYITQLIRDKLIRDFTIEVWVKPTAQVYQSDWRSTNIITMTDPSGNDGQNITIKWNNANNQFEFTVHTGFTTETNKAAVSCQATPGQLHHVVATFCGSNLRLYVDYAGAGSIFQEQVVNLGTLVNARSCGLLSIGNTSRKYRVASDTASQVDISQHRKRTFYGDLDTLRIYNRALAPEEVARLYHTYKGNVWRDDVEFPLYASIEDVSVKLLNPFFDALRASHGWSNADGSAVVKSLNLNGIPLSARAGEFIALLNENKSLESLDIRNTDFPVESVKGLLEAIINHPNLSIVAMPEGILSGDEHKMLADILAKRCVRMQGDISSLVNLGHGIANIGLLQNEHFVRWDTMLKQNSDFSDEIKRKLRLELFATFRSQPQIGNIATALQFDVSFIRRPEVITLCESSIEFKSLIRSNLSNKAREIEKSCRVLSRVSADILPATDRGILLDLNNLSTNLTQVTTALDVAGGDIAGVVLSEVIRNFEGVSTFVVDATKLTTTLFNHVSDISQLDKPLANLGALKTELTGAFNALGPILDTAGVSSTVINQVISAGHAVSTIATSVTQIINGAVVLGPIGAIAGAIGAVFSVFGGGGPSNEERMISQLSEQMNEQFNNLNRNLGRLAEHMDKQFVTVRQDIYQIGTDLKIAIYESTKALADLMGQHFTNLGANLRAEFSGIRTDIQRLQQDITKIHIQVIDVGQQINTYRVASLANQYIHLKSKALTTFFTLDYRGQGRQEYNEAITYADNLANWASGLGGVYSKRPELTLGSGVRNDADAVIAEVSNSLHGISYRIDKIRKYVIQSNPAVYGMLNTSLANPVIWADAARSYMAFIHKYLRIANAGCAKQFCEVQVRNLDKIIHSGGELIEFIQYLKNHPDVLLQLCDDYKTAVINLRGSNGGRMIVVRQAVATRVGAPAAADATCEENLRNLDKAYKLLAIIATLTFNSPRVQEYIKDRLFDREQFVYYATSEFNDEIIKNKLYRAVLDFEKLIRDVEPEYGFINDTLFSLQTTREMCASISNTPEDELRILGPGRGEVVAIEAVAGPTARPGTPISWLFKKSDAVEQDEYDIARQTLRRFLDDHNDDNDIEIDYNPGSAALKVYGSREDLQTLQNLLQVLGGLREQNPFARLAISEHGRVSLLIRIKDGLEGIIDYEYADRLFKRFKGDKRLN